jgi:hypothetical protein
VDDVATTLWSGPILALHHQGQGWLSSPARSQVELPGMSIKVLHGRPPSSPRCSVRFPFCQGVHFRRSLVSMGCFFGVPMILR